MLTPKSTPRGQLLSQYVCVRLLSMTGIDIGLFDFDRHNAIYYFVLNADEQIYLRYGGRDAESADSYLNLRSLELALERGLELHRRFVEGTLPPPPRPEPFFPRDIPLLAEHTRKLDTCVECHLIADYQAQQLEDAGQLDKLTTLFRSPDIKNLGIELDVPRGLVVKQSSEHARRSGILPGDEISAIDGHEVWTFGDLQYRYSQLPRDATEMNVAVRRGPQRLDLTLRLPEQWWVTDISYRYLTVDPLVYFKARPLTVEDKKRAGLDPAGFASRVTYVDPAVALLKRHELQVGDIVYAVDGVTADPLAKICTLHIKLRKKAGDTVELSVLRDGESLTMPLKTERQSFRK